MRALVHDLVLHAVLFLCVECNLQLGTVFLGKQVTTAINQFRAQNAKLSALSALVVVACQSLKTLVSRWTCKCLVPPNNVRWYCFVYIFIRGIYFHFHMTDVGNMDRFSLDLTALQTLKSSWSSLSSFTVTVDRFPTNVLLLLLKIFMDLHKPCFLIT